MTGNVFTEGYGYPRFGVLGNGEKFTEGSRAISEEPDKCEKGGSLIDCG